ncbi:MAG: trypsin-like peptidase domain-containing protein, partial [Actinomycetota bacterium]|nr:trypsin-like peptidase domain-containing protein [Actinomycetota bacterium]
MVLAVGAPAVAHAQGQGNRAPDDVLGATDAVVAVHTSISNGAGFVLEGAEDEVITHDAVVRSDETARVTTIDGRQLEGTVVGRDAEAGLAVLSVPGVRVGTIPLADESAEDGDDVWAVGRPLGYSDRIAALDVDDLSDEGASRRIELD